MLKSFKKWSIGYIHLKITKKDFNWVPLPWYAIGRFSTLGNSDSFMYKKPYNLPVLEKQIQKHCRSSTIHLFTKARLKTNKQQKVDIIAITPIFSLTRLNWWPRKKGPSSNLERAVSTKSNAASDAVHHFSAIFVIYRWHKLQIFNSHALFSSPLNDENTAELNESDEDINSSANSFLAGSYSSKYSVFTRCGADKQALENFHFLREGKVKALQSDCLYIWSD